MHALDVIILRNARAAGREAGHADADRNIVGASEIFEKEGQERQRITPSLSLDTARKRAFDAGYLRGLEEA